MGEVGLARSATPREKRTGWNRLGGTNRRLGSQTRRFSVLERKAKMRPIARLVLIAVLGQASVCGAWSSARGAEPATVYPDDSVAARDALPRARELAASGNLAEAARVLQVLLEQEGDRLLEVAGEGGLLFVSVRSLVHEALLGNAALLERYRQVEGVRAEKMLEDVDAREIERTRLYTRAGLTAALRVVQTEMEGGRFESARMALVQLKDHPDRRQEKGAARACALAAAQVARYVDREDVRDLAKAWAQEALALGERVEVDTRPVTIPASARRIGRSPIDAGEAIDEAMMSRTALQSIGLMRDEARLEELQALGTTSGDGPIVFPSVAGDVVYVNDGERIGAYDRDTLSPIWVHAASGGAAGTREDEILLSRPGYAMRTFEDVASCTVSGDVVLAVTGFAVNGRRVGDARLHALDARDGRRLWAVQERLVDPALVSSAVRGPVLVDGDTVVAAVRRVGTFARDTKLYLMGLDLNTGAKRWVRYVASAGRLPWGVVQRRPDGATMHHGVVYRADEMGIVAAYEAATGRPVWLRKVSGGSAMRRGQPDQAPAFAMAVPIVDGNTLIVNELTEAGDAGRGDDPAVLRLDLATGRLLEKRALSAFGSPRYFVRVGEYLAGVGAGRLAFVRSSELGEGTIRLSGPLGEGEIQGRVTVAGDKVLVPGNGGVFVVDPNDPTNVSMMELEGSGNLLAVGGHVLGADVRRLRTFVSWERAREILSERVKARPGDVGPMLNFVELAHRAGMLDEAPAMITRALERLDELAGSTRGDGATRSRRRLFEILLAIVRESAGTRAGTEKGTDPKLIQQVLQAMDRAAESFPERATYLMELAQWQEGRGEARAAVDAWQEVLSDERMAGSKIVETVGKAVPEDEKGTTAGEEAERRLARLVMRSGYDAYRSFDEEAVRAFGELGVGAKAEALEAAARRYPLARGASGVWVRAAAEWGRAGKRAEALAALGRAVVSAESIVKAGVVEQREALARAGLALVEALRDAGQDSTAYRTLRRLMLQHPGVVLTGTTRGDESLASELRERVRAGEGRPRVGATISSGVQVLRQWSLLETLIAQERGGPTDVVMMENAVTSRVGLFATQGDTGRVSALWTREYQQQSPTPVAVRLDETYLYWPTARGGTIEVVDNTTGATRWRSAEFGTVFTAAQTAAYVADEHFPTPNSGDVRAGDLMVSLDEASLILVERGGRAACFDVADGKVRWTDVLPIRRVFDVASVDGLLIVAGDEKAASEVEGQELVSSPRMMSMDRRTGAPVARVGDGGGEDARAILGDHVRWVRAAGKGRVLAGVADGVVAVDARTCGKLWSVRGGDIRNPAAGVVVGESAFVLDSSKALRLIGMGDGKLRAMPLETREKIEFPFVLSPLGDRLVVTSQRGLLVYGGDGSLVGMDALDRDARGEREAHLVPPVVGREHCVNVGEVADLPNVARAPAGLTRYGLSVLSVESGSVVGTGAVILREEPTAMALVDGKVLVTAGTVTVVLDMP